ncbi:hypothetical protein AB0A74_01125 [Saccharothrix sp. NPDC042600]|uniref:hypothetical protein n=1 Tax=Saccharothrix TaxID=2071 RepID=UPI0033D868CD|nr:hypothetical protein GCM10017745_49290 [Saccharothrix mutabilis subsp. capreolus]
MDSDVDCEFCGDTGVLRWAPAASVPSTRAGSAGPCPCGRVGWWRLSRAQQMAVLDAITVGGTIARHTGQGLSGRMSCDLHDGG